MSIRCKSYKNNFWVLPNLKMADIMVMVKI